MTDGHDHQRFETLWREHAGIACKVAAVYARNREDRRDLVQDIGVQLWRSFQRFDPQRAKFSTWMYRIALNVAISHLRRRTRDGDEHTQPLDARHLETIGGGQAIDEPDPRLAVLRELIARLDPLNRALILLYLEERSYREIAEILGISETNVATRIGRIKQKLRRQATAADTTTTGA